MEKENNTQIQALLPEIKEMLAEGKTQPEVAADGETDTQVPKTIKKEISR